MMKESSLVGDSGHQQGQVDCVRSSYDRLGCKRDNYTRCSADRVRTQCEACVYRRGGHGGRAKVSGKANARFQRARASIIQGSIKMAC